MAARNALARMLTLAAAGALVAGVACGGGGGKAAVNAAAAPETTTTTAAPGAAYTACLRDHGVDVPDRQRPAGGTPGSRPSTTLAPGATPSSRPPGTRPSTTLPPGVDQAKFDAARQACQSLMPTGGGFQNGPASAAFQPYISCMKDHGVTIDAGGNAGGGNAGAGPGARRDDPAFQAADAICGPLRPAPGTQPSTTVPPTTTTKSTGK